MTGGTFARDMPLPTQRSTELACYSMFFIRDIWVAEEQRFPSSEEAANKFGLMEQEKAAWNFIQARLSPTWSYWSEIREHPSKGEEWLAIFELGEANFLSCVFTRMAIMGQGHIGLLSAWSLHVRKGLFMVAAKTMILMKKPYTGETSRP